MHAIITVIILTILAVSSTSACGNNYPQWPQLQHANPELGWVVSDKIRGHTSRVNLYTGQDPYPFCAAQSASILHDQHECQTQNKDCTKQTRTAAVTLVSAGQSSTNIKWSDGGNTLLSLGKLLRDGGGAAHTECNYDNIIQKRENKDAQINQLFTTYQQFLSTRGYAGYMHRYYRDEFTLISRRLGGTGPHISQLLNNHYSNPSELYNDVIMSPDCYKISVVSSRKYTARSVLTGSFDVGTAHKLIGDSLSLNRPVSVNLCLNVHLGMQKCSKHSLVIYAESFARNSVTGDVRKVYKVANTWGEQWQRDHNDGWVFADLLLMGIYEIIWLV